MLYSIELIDVNENIENFKFNRISQKDLDSIKEYFKTREFSFFEFSSEEGEVLLHAQYFRGIVYTKFQDKPKTATQETKEDAVEIQKLKVTKTESK